MIYHQLYRAERSTSDFNKEINLAMGSGLGGN